MAQVELRIGGRLHNVACRDGEEAELEALGRMLDHHAPAAIRVSGAPAGERMMLFLALMLADEIAELERRAPPAAGTVPDNLLAEIAERLEAVAAALEQDGSDA
jgi:cell division protein ZapA